MTPAERVKRILDEAVGRDLSSWERHQFLVSIRSLARLSAKQESCLRKIEERLRLPEVKQ